MTPREAREFDELVSDYLEAALSPDQVAILERRVRADAECRQRYLELTALVGSLGWSLAAEPRAEVARPVRRGRWALAGATLAASVALAVWLALRAGAPPGPPGISEPEPFARVVEVGGRTEVAHAGRAATEAGAGTALFAGQTLRTDGADGFAVLELSGGSRLELGPDAQLRVAEGAAGGPRLVLTSGLLRGVVGGAAVTVHTPQAEVSLRDAQFLMSATSDVTEVEAGSGSVRLVRTADGQSLDVPAGAAAIVSAAEPMELRRPARSAKPRAEYKVSAHFGLAFTADGRTLVAGMKGVGWTRIDLASGRVEQTKPPIGEPVTGVVLTADAATYLLITRAGRARPFDPLSGADRPGFDVPSTTNGVWAASADGSRLAFARLTSGPGDRLRLWELPGGRELAGASAEAGPRCVAVSADARFVAWASDGTRKRPGHELTVWNAVTGRAVATIAVPDRPLRELAFSPDGKRIAGGTDHGAVHVWEAETGRWLAGRGAADGWARPARALLFAPDGRRLAVGLTDGSVRLWTVGTNADELLDGGRAPIFALAFARDGRTLAAGTSRAAVTLWDVAPLAD